MAKRFGFGAGRAVFLKFAFKKSKRLFLGILPDSDSGNKTNDRNAVLGLPFPNSGWHPGGWPICQGDDFPGRFDGYFHKTRIFRDRIRQLFFPMPASTYQHNIHSSLSLPRARRFHILPG